MSWFVATTEPVTKESFETSRSGLELVLLDKRAEKETKEQFEAAIERAQSLIWSVGGPEDKIMVSLAGHANPDHGPGDEGWAHEYVQITITAS